MEYDGTNVLLARYTHGPGIDDPVMIERDLDASGGFSAAERFFYQSDGLGSITELTDSTGAVTHEIVYDSYGQISQDTGGIAQPYAFTGREFDAESGLYFYRARYYDPATGRFLSQDPMGFGAGDTNLYRYVFNNPANFRDPSGRILPAAVLGAACAGGALGGVLGGFAGTVAGGAARVVVDQTLDDMEQRQRDSVGPCNRPEPSRPGDGPNKPDFPTPTPADLLSDAIINAGLGCVAGVGVVILVATTTAATVAATTAAAAAAAAVAAESFVAVAAVPLLDLF